MKNFLFQLPSKIHFGEGIVSKIGYELKCRNMQKTLIVTDSGIVDAGLTTVIEDSLKYHGIEYILFDKVQANPNTQIIYQGAELYQESGCCSLVAIGGGSCIDSAKAIGILATNGGKVEDYEGFGHVKNPLPFIVAIPTTYGTGSEVSTATIVTDEIRHVKMFIGSDYLAPAIAMIDPLLLIALPFKIAASTGLDALTHAIESYVSINENPFSDSLNEYAIRTISKNLLPAASTNDNVEATSYMVTASCMTAIAFNYTALGLVHGIAHALGGLYNIPHGVANALLLPYVMEYNLLSKPHKFARIAELMGEDINGITDVEAGYKSVIAVKRMSKLLGIPEKLSEIGIEPDKFTTIAQFALKDGNVGFNPRTVRLDNIISILNSAL